MATHLPPGAAEGSGAGGSATNPEPIGTPNPDATIPFLEAVGAVRERLWLAEELEPAGILP
jgi:hypothetical protein